MLNAFDQITNLCRLFKFHVGCKLFHLFFQLLYRLPVMSGQKMNCLFHLPAVVLF